MAINWQAACVVGDENNATIVACVNNPYKLVFRQRREWHHRQTGDNLIKLFLYYFVADDPERKLECLLYVNTFTLV